MALDKFRRDSRQRIDFWLMLMVLGLVAFGLVMVSSASVVVAYKDYGSNNYFLVRQLWAAVAGLVAMVGFTMIDYRVWQRYATPIGVGMLVFLVLPHIPGVGSVANGAQRWITVAGISLQLSEPVKLLSILYLAAWFTTRERTMDSLKETFVPFAIGVGVIVGAILLQPDAGTAITLGVVLTAMYFLAGAKPTHLGYLGLAAAAGLFLILQSPYRAQRLLVFLNPSQATLGAGYHINQALLAVGSGGWFGLGFGQSVQKYLFLPEVQTDSIFAVATEELGFLRMTLVFLIYAAVVARGYRVARLAPDRFGQLVAFGITTLLAVQTMVNIGAMLGVMPLTGVTLPLMSYGGSSLISTLAAIGVLLSISKHSQKDAA